MKLRTLSLSLLLTVLANGAFAQTPAGAPAGTTGVCKDGTFSSAPSKAGACSGHKGVKTWMGSEAAEKPAVIAPAAPAGKPAVATAASATTAATAKSATTVAAGAGPDKVWVNAASKVYHCPGTKYYGKTKKGSYMTEAEATAAGNHADHKKACTK
jgi:hypothetical protein